MTTDLVPDLIPDAIQFAENPEPRCLCVLLVDVSSSMAGKPIDELNNGIATFARELKSDPLASMRTEVAIVTFAGDAKMAQDFVTADKFNPQPLTADEGVLMTEDQCYAEPLRLGDGIDDIWQPHYMKDGLYCYRAGFRLSGGTYTSEGINLALDKIEERKQAYRDNGIDYYRPWLFLITDGEPTEHPDSVTMAAHRLKNADIEKKVAAFSVGVEGADLDKLAEISPRRPLVLKGLKFSSMFTWLSKSMSRVSASRISDEITLDTNGLKDWAAI